MKNGQTSVLFKYFVKNQLKKQDLRYSDLAEHLNLSLAAVKKIMTEGDFKLSRMESIASWLGFTLLEALQIIDNESYAKSFLTPSQEKILANDPMNFYVLILLGCGFSLKEVSSRTQISQQNLQKIQINDKGPAETKETHLDLFRKVLEFNRWQRRRTTLVSSEFSINRS
jgi:transcriptional regulator with XRE-family HTH domain